MTGGRRLSLRVPCDGSAVAGLVGAVEAFFARQEGLPPELLPNVALALDEVVMNIVSYAHPAGGEHFIEVDLVVASGEVDIVVSDDGIPFDPLQAPRPDTSLDLEERQAGGLGILLVTELMDRVRYERTDSRNRLHLTKTFLPRA